MALSARYLLGLLIALAGSLLAKWLSVPLPWLLGALIATAATRMAGLPSQCPRQARHGGQWMLGISLGLYFTPAIAAELSDSLGIILAGMGFALFLGVMGTVMLRKLAGVDGRTAWFASAIGGASEMTLLAERHGARPDQVASAHSLRILLVVLIVPYLFRWWGVTGMEAYNPAPTPWQPAGFALLLALTAVPAMLMQKLRLPNAWILGPLLLTCLLTASSITLSSIPTVLVNLGQFCIGWSLGNRYRPDFLRSAPRLLLATTLVSLMGIALAFGVGAVLARYSSLPMATLTLGMAPGGIAEMAITAKVLKLGAPMVTAFQLSRMVFVMAVTAPLYHLYMRLQPRQASKPAG